MRPKIRTILEECIEQGIVNGFDAAHEGNDRPMAHQIIGEIEDAIWLEINHRFDFERNLFHEVVEGLVALKSREK